VCVFYYTRADDGLIKRVRRVVFRDGSDRRTNSVVGSSRPCQGMGGGFFASKRTLSAVFVEWAHAVFSARSRTRDRNTVRKYYYRIGDELRNRPNTFIHKYIYMRAYYLYNTRAFSVHSLSTLSKVALPLKHSPYPHTSI